MSAEAAVMHPSYGPRQAKVTRVGGVPEVNRHVPGLRGLHGRARMMTSLPQGGRGLGE